MTDELRELCAISYTFLERMLSIIDIRQPTPDEMSQIERIERIVYAILHNQPLTPSSDAASDAASDSASDSSSGASSALVSYSGDMGSLNDYQANRYGSSLNSLSSWSPSIASSGLSGYSTPSLYLPDDDYKHNSPMSRQLNDSSQSMLTPKKASNEYVLASPAFLKEVATAVKWFDINKYIGESVQPKLIKSDKPDMKYELVPAEQEDIEKSLMYYGDKNNRANQNAAIPDRHVVADLARSLLPNARISQTKKKNLTNIFNIEGFNAFVRANPQIFKESVSNITLAFDHFRSQYA
jgi:hypothetical protein